MSDSDATAERLERGRRLFAGTAEFLLSATSPRQFTDESLPEVALAGRSNVGKSSLINALTGRRSLARTSRQPGRTQAINFFRIAERLSLVDLPGYGFAQAPRKEVDAWMRLISHYLGSRANLRRVLLLIDARRGVMTADRDVMEEFSRSGVAFQVVLTKADAVSRTECDTILAATATEVRRHPSAVEAIVTVSARKRTGIDELRAQLADLAASL